LGAVYFTLGHYRHHGTLPLSKLFRPSSPPPEPPTLHARAAESARESRGHLVSLATGSLALFFIALTGKTDPPLTPAERIVTICAVAALGLTVFAGIWGSYADAHWSYHWAKQIESDNANNPVTSAEMSTKAERWHWHKRWTEWATMLLFAIGIAFAVAYLFMRI
jgi:hypothetical protein